METFDELNLPSKIMASLKAMKFTTPTPIQAQTIPLSLAGKDVIGTAQTGTGKTGAFGIPLAGKILENKNESLIVLTPTRELAVQVMKVFMDLLAVDKSVKTALLIGGESIDRQFRQLSRNPRVVVGTPGRINDHLNRGSLDLSATASLVLDETDLMLDMGFDVQIETIIDCMPTDRQTLMFSATLPPRIEKLASRYLVNPERVSVGAQSTPGEGITQETINVQDHEKYSTLVKELDERTGSVIIFVKTKRGADRLARQLNDEKHKSAAIHGDLRQSKRDSILNGFRKERFRIMVATDVAARGIDVPHIRHVINYDLPQCPEDYVHRIGRTGRAGETGCAVSFIGRSDRSKWRAIERIMDPNAPKDDGGRSFQGGRGGRGGSRSGGGRSGGFGGGRSFDRGADRGGDRGGRSGGGFRSGGFRGRSDDRSEGRSFEKRSEGRSEGRSFEKKRFDDNRRDFKRDDRDGGFKRDDFKRQERGGDRRDFKRDDRDGGFKRHERGGDRRDFKRDDSRRSEGRPFSDRSSDRRDGGSFDKRKSFDRSTPRGNDRGFGSDKKPFAKRAEGGSNWRDRKASSGNDDYFSKDRGPKRDDRRGDSRGGRSEGGFKPKFGGAKSGGSKFGGGSKPRFGSDKPKFGDDRNASRGGDRPFKAKPRKAPTRNAHA